MGAEYVMRCMWIELLQHRAQMESQNVQTSHLLRRLGDVEMEKTVVQEQLVAMKNELDTALTRLTTLPRVLKIKVDPMVKVRPLFHRVCPQHLAYL
jgi:hypothetical protein